MDKPKQGQCLLKSVSGTHPHIEISANGDTFVGRSRETQIADTLVSKKHLKMRCDFDKKCVIVELLGLNPSTLNGKNLVKNNQSKAFNGDLIEIIPSKYPYKVHIEVDESMKSTKSTDDTTDRKRKRSIEEQRTSMNEPVFKKLKWTTKIVLDVKNKVAGSQWESYNNGQLLVYTPIDCKSSHKIAAYDMDGTLIATKSGKVWPKDADDWKLAFGTVATTLRAKHSDGYKIVILTNQGGISAGTTKITEIKKKIETIIKTLGVPIQAFVASGYDSFRKPLTGMWQALCDLKNDNIKIDMSHSFYVGDAAGRPENKIIKKKKDHSSVDRLMALNLELTFFTPEEHFLKASPQKWVQPEFNPKDYLSRDLKLINDPSVRIASTDLELILLVGGPGTGKSRFCKDYLENENYEIVSRDVLGSWQKCVDRVNDCLKNRRKVVVDNTNGDRASRARYVNAAKKHNLPCRCFVMTTTFNHARHNIVFRELTDKKHSKINKIVLNSYKKNYEDPSSEEGFSDIVRVNFVPTFKDERDRSLYEMFLLAD